MGRADRGREKYRAEATCASRGEVFYHRGRAVYVSIVRVGLAETRNFAEGYEAIFGKKKEKAAEPKKSKPTAKASTTNNKNNTTKK
jgi:hypothetical protein